MDKAIKWTEELVREVKLNEKPHGLLREQYKRIAEGIEAAYAAGAVIEHYSTVGWSSVRTASGVWFPHVTYRVSPSWTPPTPEPEVERCEVHGPDDRCDCLHYHRDGDTHALDWAVNEPDFIAYGYERENGSIDRRSSPRIVLDSKDATTAPTPVIVLFRRRA